MWLLVGITVLLSRAVMANPTDESAYYLAETNDDRSLDGIEKPRYEKTEVEASETTSSSETQMEQTENRGLDDSIINRSVTNTDLNDQSLEKRQAPAPLATLLYWPEMEDETVGMELRRNPMTQERRNPAFSPWGGKRDVQPRYKTITKIRRPVRVPFNSWGGKRDNAKAYQHPFTDLKKGKFFNWGGKRSPAFHSWGGKRSPAFNSWGGKRSPAFNSWGGKRGIRENVDDYDPSRNYRYYQRNRKASIADFDNELESREENYHDELGNINEVGKKRGSVKLIARGEMTTSGSTMGETLSRVPFEPWGGKKRKHSGCSNDDSSSASVSMILCKIGQLIPSNV